jgi:hypothetical protein
MADFNFQPARSSIAPQPGMSLGDMMNMAGQAQALQQAQQMNPLQLQSAQQTVEQARQMYPLQLRQQTAVTTGAESKLPFEIRSSEAAAKTAEFGTSSAEFDLATKRTNGIVSRLTGLINNPMVIEAERNLAYAEANKEQLAKIVTAYGEQQAKELKIPSDEANVSIAPYLSTVTQTPGEFRQFLKHKLLTTIDHASRISALQPSGVQTSTGAVNQVVSTNEFGPYPPGTTIPGTLAVQQPGPTTSLVAREGDGTNLPPGTPYIIGPQGPKSATAQPTSPMVTGNPPAYVPTTPIILPPGETSETAALAKNIQLKANEAARAVQATQFNNNQLIRLADKSFTGVGASAIANLGGGYAALPWTTDATSNLQSLGHYMASETKNLATSSGLSTDAGRGLSEQVSGSTVWTNDSIKSTARINRALSTGVSLFNQGVNNAVETAKGNPFAARDFQNKWSQIATVDAFRLMDAKKNNDVDGMKKIIKEMGGIDSKKFKDVVQQVKFVDNLVGANK